MRAKPILPPTFNIRSPKGICRWCGEPIIDPKTKQVNRRRNWHREKCLDEYFFATDPAYARRRTFERDGGKCQCCGLDLKALIERRADIWRRAHPSMWDWSESKATAMAPEIRAAEVEFEKLRHEMMALGFKESHIETGDNLWQMDHVIPVYKSGGDLSWFKPENTQTLCWPCHKIKTKQDMKTLRTERAMRQLHPDSWRAIMDAGRKQIPEPKIHVSD